MTDAALSQETGTVVSGITTDAVLEPAYGPRGLRVTWIAWDSALRESDLALGDLIVAVDGVSLADALRPGLFASLTGQANDSIGWQQRGAEAGQLIRLTVRRDDVEHEIEGRLSPERLYRDTEGRSSLAPGGPARLANDGFADAWSRWYEDIVRSLSMVLPEAWRWPSMDTRRTLGELLAQAPRIETLTSTYPGPFAEAMRADWQGAVDCVRGTRVEDLDLEYRELGAKRLELVAAEAKRAWEEFVARTGAVAAFPAPPEEERATLSGKVVLLPALTERDWVTDLGRSFAAVTESSGAYFVRLTGSAPFLRAYGARERFRANVAHDLEDSWEFAGSVTGDPIMLKVGRAVVTGYVLEPLVVRSGGGSFVVDVSAVEPDGTSLFAGEPLLKPVGNAGPADDATPAEVVEALVNAVKTADEAGWRALFAPWQAGVYDGRVLYNPLDPPGENLLAETWSKARAQITGDVYDVRVHHVEPTRTVIAAQPDAGLPEVEATVVWTDPIGLFDGGYRSFGHYLVHRRWPLQRVDGGPWRIVTVQSL